MRKRLVTVALAVVALLGACSGGGGESTQMAGDTTVPEQPPTSVVDTTVPAPPPTPPPPATKGRRTIQYPAGGPAGPVFPPGTKAYHLLSRGQCRGLLDEINGEWSTVDRPLVLLYRAAAQACLSQWNAAIVDLDELRRLGPSFGTTCSQEGPCERCHQIVLAWLTMVIDTYRANPQSPPRFTRSKAGSPCPPETGNGTSTTTTTTTTTSSDGGAAP